MSVDPKIIEAIELAVTKAGQPEGLARKLARWFEAIASGNENINATQSANRHLELLYDETQPPSLEKLLEELVGESSSEELT
ncbi:MULTISPECIES: CxC ATPase DNA modification system associated small protein [Rhodomicrobium]|uniref:CxC ATPase DNA modification system associated small protein n=1 Tax=Rhodomicrobium TaxID=1068 RepID=UPI000B4AFA72|nr:MULTISPECIES: CxC ATPase DNA modification system associated small protein [Rhodomicrobium]